MPEDLTARPACTCGHIACVCGIIAAHEEDCPFRRSAACSVGIECEHGYDVCPICDPCTCSGRAALAQDTKGGGNG